jgi:hypothetical protein
LGAKGSDQGDARIAAEGDSVRYELIDEREAPPRPVLHRGAKRRLEMNELLDALEPGVIAKVEPVNAKRDPDASGANAWEPVEQILLEAAAFYGARVAIWTDESGAVYVRLDDQRGAVATGSALGRFGITEAPA